MMGGGDNRTNAVALPHALMPSPPRPTTPMRIPFLFSPWVIMGLYVVIPAH